MFRIAVFTVILLLAGCISLSRITRPDLDYNIEEGREPQLSEVDSAGVGDVVYWEFRFRINPTVRLTEDLSTPNADISSSVRLSKMIKDGNVVYGTLSVSDESITYLRDKDGNGKFDRYMVQARKNATGWKKLDEEVDYVEAGGIRSETGGKEAELILENIDTENNELTFLYTAYMDDLVSPSETETIVARYSVGNESEFTFRTFKMLIQEVKDREIVYTIESGFGVHNE